MHIDDLFATAAVNSPVYVIAEAGVNHNGDPEMAVRLIHEARKAGADAVKFQTFRACDIVTRKSPKAQYQYLNTDQGESQYEMLEKLELSYEVFSMLKQECHKAGIDFLSTPYNTSDIDILESLQVPALKIASAMAVEPDFLSYAAATGKPILLSTGMCTLDEVTSAVDVLKNARCEHIILLQCTTNYPAAVEEANLRSMVNMGKTFNIPYGYSDHTQSNISVIAAVALGACIVEKHFTLDKKLPGPDHSSSCDPQELQSYIQAVRDTTVSLGTGIKAPSDSELINRPMMRRGVVASQDISAGTILEKKHIAYKRPETSLKPSQVEGVLGRKIKRDLLKDEEIKLEYL